MTGSAASNGTGSTPALVGDNLYVGGGNGVFYSFSISSGILDVAWEFKTEDRIPATSPSGLAHPLPSYIFSTPAVDLAGRIYFGAANRNFYCLNADGSLRWLFPTGAEIQSSPAIAADGTIYFGSGDKKFYALDSAGHEKWHFTTTSDIYGSPALATDGTIYFGGRDSNLYALRPDGVLKWVFPTGGYIERTVVIGSDGTIYFGSFDGKIYALYPDGSKKWSVSTGQEGPAGALVGSLALGSDGTIYAATGGDGQQLIAISPQGAKLWSYRFGPVMIYSYSSAPAIGPDGTLYVGAADKKVYALNPDGTLKWATFVDSLGFSAPSLSDDGIIYINGGSMKLTALNTDGEILANFDMPNPGVSGGTVSAPTFAANHKLYVGSGNGKLYAFSTSGGLQLSAWPTTQGNSQRTARPPALNREVAGARTGGNGAIKFEVSIYDLSARIEASTDFQNWTSVPFQRVGNTIEVISSSENPSAFYRIRYFAEAGAP